MNRIYRDGVGGVLTEPPGAPNESSRFRKNKKHVTDTASILDKTFNLKPISRNEFKFPVISNLLSAN